MVSVSFWWSAGCELLRRYENVVTRCIARVQMFCGRVDESRKYGSREAGPVAAYSWRDGRKDMTAVENKGGAVSATEHTKQESGSCEL